MAASYPAAPVTFPVRVDGTPFDDSYINALQDEVAAVETSLMPTGYLPSPLTVGGTRPQVVLDNMTGTKGYLRAEPHYMILGQNLTKDAAGNATQPNPAYASTQWLLSSLAAGNRALLINGANAMADPPTVTSRLDVGFDGAIYERGRTAAAMGDWIVVPTNGVGISSSGGTWTVGTWSYSYALIGRLMLLNIYLSNGVITGTPAYLRINTPLAVTASSYGMCACVVGGVWTECLYTLGNGTSTISIYGNAAAGAWPAAASGVTVCASIGVFT